MGSKLPNPATATNLGRTTQALWALRSHLLSFPDDGEQQTGQCMFISALHGCCHPCLHVEVSVAFLQLADSTSLTTQKKTKLYYTPNGSGVLCLLFACYTFFHYFFLQPIYIFQSKECLL